jgi:cytidylate kinase
MIRLVTIDREYGSGGGDIARKVAETLGWKLWDQALTDEIARVLDCPSSTVGEHEEVCDSLYYRLFRSFMRGSFEGSLNAPRLKMVDADCIREVARKAVSNIAETGHGVLVGRGSGYYLRGRPDAFHVFVYAPFEEKVRRLMAKGKREAEAMDLAETVDRDRSEYIKKYFDIEWPERHVFDLMVNSTRGDDIAADTIVHAVSLLARQPV